jgi:hypothetical protein
MTSHLDDVYSSTGVRWSSGLWRGMVIDPADGGSDGARRWCIHDIRREISRGADPIQDVKGLGVKLVSVFSKHGYFRPHFRQHDADFNRVMRTALPIYHDACVRVLCEHLRRGGYAALESMCRPGVMPDVSFDFAAVELEQLVVSGSQTYRPDILIRPAQKELPDIEVELVNTHAPTDVRLESAENRGALVVWADIRGIVRDLVLDNRRDLVPDDAVLLGRVKGLSFRAVLQQIQDLYKIARLGCRRARFTIRAARTPTREPRCRLGLRRWPRVKSDGIALLRPQRQPPKRRKRRRPHGTLRRCAVLRQKSMKPSPPRTSSGCLAIWRARFQG